MSSSTVVCKQRLLTAHLNGVAIDGELVTVDKLIDPRTVPGLTGAIDAGNVVLCSKALTPLAGPLHGGVDTALQAHLKVCATAARGLRRSCAKVPNLIVMGLLHRT